MSARSPLRLRLWLAVFGLVFCSALAVLMLLPEDPSSGLTVAGIGFGVLALVALIDLVVVVRRLRSR